MGSQEFVQRQSGEDSDLSQLREAIEKTLMDLRELISNLENPFNYIAMLTGSPEVNVQAREGGRGTQRNQSMVRDQSARVEGGVGVSGEVGNRVEGAQVSRGAGGKGFINALMAMYVVIRRHGIDKQRAYSILSTLHGYGLMDNESYRACSIALELLSDTPESLRLNEFLRLIASVSLVSGAEADYIIKLINLVSTVLTSDSRPYEVVVF